MKILELIKKNKEKLPDHNDLLIIIGSTMAGYGLHMIYPPLTWIIGGVLIAYLGWPKRAVK